MKRAHIIVCILAILLLSYCGVSQPTSFKNNETEKTEMIAKLSKAVNYDAWEKLSIISWTFNENHHYVWDRDNNDVQVEWKQYKVLFNSKTEKGIVFKNKEEIVDDKKLRKAIDFFNNDSFWLLAYTKLFDDGVEVALATMEDSTEGLMITYNTGGTTPGDKYFWELDEDGLPKSWRMWVSIIPIGGLKTTWEDWIELHNGAMVAKKHKGTGFSVDLTNIKSGDRLEDIGELKDLFQIVPH